MPQINSLPTDYNHHFDLQRDPYWPMCNPTNTRRRLLCYAGGSLRDILNRGPYDPYTCCVDCLIQILGGCVAWANVPGVSCTLLEGPTIYKGTRCPNGPLNGAIFQNLAKYPDGLGGSGPCAGTVSVVKT